MTPFLDLCLATAEVRAEVDQAIARVLDLGRYIQGPEVEVFEREFARFCGARYCVGVARGLDAAP
jgi:dTDP-4-amino-4,6-dideoxygalactose transaminase